MSNRYIEEPSRSIIFKQFKNSYAYIHRHYNRYGWVGYSSFLINPSDSLTRCAHSLVESVSRWMGR